MGRPRIHHLDEDAVVNAYQDGATIVGLARDHGVDRTVIRRVLRDNEIQLGGRSNVIDLPSNHLDELPPGYVTGPDLAIHAGISYRQLDHWTRTGLLHPLEATPGSGHARAYPTAELAAASLVKRLLDAGMQPRPAFTIARDLLEHGHAQLAGIRIDLPTEL